MEMSPDQTIVQSVMDEIKRDAEIEYMLSDKFIQKDNILRHFFDGFSETEVKTTWLPVGILIGVLAVWVYYKRN